MNKLEPINDRIAIRVHVEDAGDRRSPATDADDSGDTVRLLVTFPNGAQFYVHAGVDGEVAVNLDLPGKPSWTEILNVDGREPISTPELYEIINAYDGTNDELEALAAEVDPPPCTLCRVDRLAALGLLPPACPPRRREAQEER
jgi:hypothetical protein